VNLSLHKCVLANLNLQLFFGYLSIIFYRYTHRDGFTVKEYWHPLNVNNIEVNIKKTCQALFVLNSYNISTMTESVF